MIAFFQWLLLKLPPEPAHRIAVRALRLQQWLRFRLFRRPLMGAPQILRIPGARTLAFPGRVGLAAGFDKNAEVFAALMGMGFSFVEVGTVTPEPQPGNPPPRIWRHPPDALVNALGFNNHGLQAFRENIARYRRFTVGRPLLANIGKGKDTPLEKALGDYQRGFEQLVDCVDGFVVNLSSPNTPGLRDLQSVAFLEGLARIAPLLPVWIKLAPDLDNAALRALVEQIGQERRFSGVVLTNTSRELAQIRGRESGGLSGRPLLERALEAVSVAREVLPSTHSLIGVGGIFDIASARRFREAGADLVEIYTGFVYRGPALVRELQDILK